MEHNRLRVLNTMERLADFFYCQNMDWSRSDEILDDLLLLARDHRRLCDPTPLRADHVIDLGGDPSDDPRGEYINFWGWHVYPKGPPERWEWFRGIGVLAYCLVPRTLGELEMFCELIRGRDNL